MPLKDKEKRKAYQAAWAKKNEIELSERRAKWDKDNPGRHKATAADWYIKNKELTKERSKAHRIKNIEHVKIIKKIYQTKNKERIRQHSFEWRAENKERLKISKAEYHAANKHEISKRGAIWRESHQEELRAASRKYRQSNPEKFRINNNNREAKKRGNGGKLSPDIIFRLLKIQGTKCAICKVNVKKTGYHLDHIVPVSRGGKNSDANVQITCPKCNLKKRDSDPIAFMQSLGYLL
jgi:hypothetical protein